MTKEELLLAVGQVEDDLLANCEAKVPRQTIWKLVAAAALVACAVMGAAIGRFGTEPVPTDSQPQWECSMLSAMNGEPAAFRLEAFDVADVWNKGTYQDENAPREMTVTFDGVCYTGQYRYSICVVGCGKIKDYYQSEDPDATFAEFSVDRESGALTGIDFVTWDYFEANEKTEALEDPMNTLPGIAKQWASHFIDVEQYKMRLDSTRVMQDPRTILYIYAFVKEVDGTGTTDQLQLLITDRGLLGWIGTKQLGWVENHQKQLEVFATVDPKALIQRDTNLTGVTVQEYYYGITPEGKVVMLVNCSVTVKGSMTAGAVIVIENTTQ